VVDNRSSNGVKIVGGWTLVDDAPTSFGGDYLAGSPSGTRSVSFTPNLPSSGTYNLYIRGVKSSSNSSRTLVDILVNGGVKKTFTVDQRSKSGWVQLGQFDFGKGSLTSVRIRNTGADGTVVADAVRFQRTTA